MQEQTMHVRTGALVLLSLVCYASPSSAGDGPQDDHGWLASGLLGAAVARSSVSPILDGLLGYQINHVVRWEILDVTYAPFLEHPVHVSDPGSSAFWNDGQGLIYSTVLTATDKAVGIVTSNLRVKLLSEGHRLSPYMLAGVGLGRLRENLLLRPRPVTVGLLGGTVEQPRRSDDFRIADWRAPYGTLVLGGGVSLARTDHLSLDLDIRYSRVFRGEDFSTSKDFVVWRTGIGFTYRP
jgi:opacity protein-like surface antigen